MTLAFFIVAALGGLLFLFNLGRVIIASFRHHPITGLISLIPGINIVVLPTIWSRIGNAFMLGIVGLACLIGGWLAGGQNWMLKESGILSELQISQPLAPPAVEKTVAEQAADNEQPTKKYREIPLPAKSLYKLVYVKTSLDQLPKLAGRQVRLTLKNGSNAEGKLHYPGNQHIELLPESTQILIEDIHKLEYLDKASTRQ